MYKHSITICTVVYVSMRLCWVHILYSTLHIFFSYYFIFRGFHSSYILLISLSTTVWVAPKWLSQPDYRSPNRVLWSPPHQTLCFFTFIFAYSPSGSFTVISILPKVHCLLISTLICKKQLSLPPNQSPPPQTSLSFMYIFLPQRMKFTVSLVWFPVVPWTPWTCVWVFSSHISFSQSPNKYILGIRSTMCFVLTVGLNMRKTHCLSTVYTV